MYNFVKYKEEQVENKEGKLTAYRKVARAALINWNGVSEEEADGKIRKETFEQLEAQVGAAKSMTNAVEAIVEKLGMTGSEAAKFLERVLGKDRVFEGENEFSKDMGYVGRNNRVMLWILSKIHDRWVLDNASKFHKEGREGKRYQHLPIELIGWKETKADLLFLTPIIETMGGKVNEEALEKTYEATVSKFVDYHDINSKTVLSKLIMEGNDFYPALHTGLNDTKKPEIATAMADQAMERNPYLAAAIRSKNMEG